MIRHPLAITGTALSLVLFLGCRKPTELRPAKAAAEAVPANQLEWIISQPWGEGNADGIGENARFAGALSLTADPRGGLFITDSYAHTLRHADAHLHVTTLAGKAGVAAHRDGAGAQARFDHPAGLTATSDGTVYVADQWNHVIRKVSPDGQVSTLAGHPGQSGHQDGPASQALFHSPSSVALDAQGRLWVADVDNGALRILSPEGNVSTWRTHATPHPPEPVTHGEAEEQAEDSPRPGIENFPHISQVVLAPDGSLLVAGEWGISRIQGGSAQVLVEANPFEDLPPSPPPSETASANDDADAAATDHAEDDNAIPPPPPPASETIAQPSPHRPSLHHISGLTVRPDGTILVADSTQGQIFRLSLDGQLHPVAGHEAKEPVGRQEAREGNAETAQIQGLGSLAVDREGRLFAANQAMSAQEILPDGSVRNALGLARWYKKAGISPDTLMGDADVAVETPQGHVFVLARLDSEIHEFDSKGHRVRQFGLEPPSLGEPDHLRHIDGNPSQSRFHYPQDLALGRAGELFVADGGSGTIRRIAPDGQVSTLAGGTATPKRTDGTFQEARFFQPHRLAFDGGSKLYVLDTSPYVGGGPVLPVIRCLDLETQQVSTVLPGFVLSGEPQDPEFDRIVDLAMGSQGLHLLSESGQVYTWKPDGQPQLVFTPPKALAPETEYNAAGIPIDNSLIRAHAPCARLEHLAVDARGNIYLTDTRADLILRVDPGGNLDIIAGTLGVRGNVAGPLPSSLEYPEGLSIAPNGDLLIALMYSGVARIRAPHMVPGTRIRSAKP